MVARGRFIAFEGGEGTGKSTQARMLCAALAQRGLEAVATREPGGTPGAEAIRSLLLSPPGDGWNARAEALLFAAARSDHVERLIRPALERGSWVVSDRFVDSSRAYHDGVDRDAIGGRDEAYHARVAAGFRALAKADPAGFRVIDGNGAPDTVHRLVLDALAPLLEPLR
mgnify:CR=1 FL=1